MNAPSPLLVACLCAEWCGTCRDYRALFDGMAAEFAGRADFCWIDIEDHADALGDLEVDTFPTLLIAQGDATLFLGPLMPQASVLARMLDNAIQGVLPAVADAAAATDLPQRVRRIGPAGR